MSDSSPVAIIENRYERLNFGAFFAHFVSAPATATARAKSNHFPDHLVVALIAGGPVGRGGRLAGIKKSIFLSFLVVYGGNLNPRILSNQLGESSEDLK